MELIQLVLLEATQGRNPPAAPTEVFAYVTACMHIARLSMPASRTVAWGRAKGDLARVAGAIALALTGMLRAGCGGGPTLTASKLVDRVNNEGVEMHLGRRLPASGDAKDLFAVTLPPVPGEPAPAPGSDQGPGGTGTLYVYGDTGAADDQRSGGLRTARNWPARAGRGRSR